MVAHKGSDTRSCLQGGWRVSVTQGPISGEPTIEEYSRQLGNVISLPEMLFGGSSVQMEHVASGFALRFDALDALRAWRAEALPPLQVSVAQAWQQARAEEISKQDAAMLEYDWTFTTPYAGTLVPPGGEGAIISKALPASPRRQRPQQQQQQEAGPGRQGDSSSEPCSVGSAVQQLETGGGGGGGRSLQQPPAGGSPGWLPSSEPLDRRLLMARDPILFYADVQLYESELDDNGVASLSLRLRVMPRCWFAVLRFWLRVDGCLVRLRETRLMARWDDPAAGRVVLRETKHLEGSWQELRAAGAPPGGQAYEDADAAAAVFTAIAPVGTRLYRLERLELAAAGAAAVPGGPTCAPPAGDVSSAAAEQQQ